MAAAPAGDGSFRTVAMGGFDKAEVNAYIDTCRKRIQEAEMYKKTCEDRITAAQKDAEEARKEAEELKKQLMAASTEFEVKLKTERRNSDLLTNQVDELKRKLKNGGGRSGASTAEAEKKSAEIIDAANAQAREIIERAKKTAQSISASAGGASAGSGVSTEFIETARKFVELINSGFKNVAEQAAALGAAVTGVPEFPQAAPRANAPAQEVMALNVTNTYNPTAENTGKGDMFAFGDIPNQSDNDMITEVQPLNPMGESMFSMDSMDGIGAVEEIAPIDEGNSASFDDDFTATLLAQSSAVTEPEPVMANFGAEAPAAENPWASLQAEFNNLGGNEDSTGYENSTENSAVDPGNPWASLQAELNSLGGGIDTGSDNGIGADNGGFGSDNGFSGNDGGFGGYGFDSGESYNDDPQVPDTDDSSLWNFGGSDSSDSDDMSSDLFGGF